MLLEKYGMQNGILMPCVMQYGPAAVLYSTLLDRILHSQCLVCFILIMVLVADLSHRHVHQATVISLCLFPSLRLTVTTGRA